MKTMAVLSPSSSSSIYFMHALHSLLVEFSDDESKYRAWNLASSNLHLIPSSLKLALAQDAGPLICVLLVGSRDHRCYWYFPTSFNVSWACCGHANMVPMVSHQKGPRQPSSWRHDNPTCHRHIANVKACWHVLRICQHNMADISN